VLADWQGLVKVSGIFGSGPHILTYERPQSSPSTPQCFEISSGNLV
jgi:hypothetical protein